MLWIDRVGVLLFFLPLLAIVYYLIGDITFGRNKASWIFESKRYVTYKIVYNCQQR